MEEWSYIEKENVIFLCDFVGEKVNLESTTLKK